MLDTLLRDRDIILQVFQRLLCLGTVIDRQGVRRGETSSTIECWLAYLSIEIVLALDLALGHPHHHLIGLACDNLSNHLLLVSLYLAVDNIVEAADELLNSLHLFLLLFLLAFKGLTFHFLLFLQSELLSKLSLTQGFFI